jgi:predicted nucleic acid-binding protein
VVRDPARDRADRWRATDASVRVARFVPADLHHEASRAYPHDHLADGGRLALPPLLPMEVAGAVSRRTGDQRQADFVVSLLRATPGLYWVGLSGELRDQAASLAVRLRLRGADAVYVALADHLSVPPGTWDSEHLTRASGQVRTYTPASRWC